MDEKAGDAVFVDLKNYMFARCRSKRSGLAISKNVVCDEETPPFDYLWKDRFFSAAACSLRDDSTSLLKGGPFISNASIDDRGIRPSTLYQPIVWRHSDEENTSCSLLLGSESSTRKTKTSLFHFSLEHLNPGTQAVFVTISHEIWVGVKPESWLEIVEFGLSQSPRKTWNGFIRFSSRPSFSSTIQRFSWWNGDRFKF